MEEGWRKAYEITCFPDLSLPRYFDLFGEEAHTISKTRLFGWLQLAVGHGTVGSFTLRYSFDPTRRPAHKRLRIFLLHTGTADDRAYAIGQRLVGEVVDLVGLDANAAVPPEADMEYLAFLERQATLAHIASDAFYLPAVWNRQQTARDAGEPYLDEALAALAAPCFLDIQLYGADAAVARQALRATIEHLTNRRQTSGGAGDEQLSHLQALSASISSDPVCHLLVCAGSRERGAAESLLRAFGVDAIGGSRFKIRSFTAGEPAHARLLGAIRDGTFEFTDGSGWYSPSLREAVGLESKPSSQIESLKKHSELSVLAGPELIRDVLTLPIPRRGFLRTFPLETEEQRATAIVPAAPMDGEIILGTNLERQSQTAVSLVDLTRHAFVAGVTGSGKTVTMFNILQQLGRQEIPFLVLEPAKAEYRGLTRYSPLDTRMRVYTPGRDYISPLRINPFGFEPHVSLTAHIAGLSAAFTCALELFSPLSSILESTLWDLYEKKGWREDDLGDVGHDLPYVGELAEAVCDSIDAMGYDPEVRDRFKGAIRSRFLRLSRGSVGRVFGSRRSHPSMEGLCGGQTVVELAGLAQHESNLVIMFLLIGVREHLSAARQAIEKPKLIMVLEEAHNLVPAVPDEHSGGEEASAKVEASRYISNMLAEMRALGLGMIIVDQTPAAVAAQVVRNTNLKIAHRTVAKQDRETLADAMLMHPEHAELLGRLVPGQAYIYADRFFRPHLLRVPFRSPEVTVAGSVGAGPGTGGPVLDDTLGAWLAKQAWYRNALDARIEELNAATEAALSGFGGLEESLEAARTELADLAGRLASAEVEGTTNAPAELATAFRDTQLRHGPSIRGFIRDLERQVRSLEAEGRAIATVSRRLRRKAPSGELIAACGEKLDALRVIASKLGLTSNPL